MQSFYRYLSTNYSRQTWTMVCLLLATFESAASAQIAAEIPSKALEAMQLRTPAWKSPTVHRESSILLQDAQAVPTARLAFPASEIIELRTAMTGKVFQEGIDWKLDATKSTIQWVGPLPCETIRTSSFHRVQPPTATNTERVTPIKTCSMPLASGFMNATLKSPIAAQILLSPAKVQRKSIFRKALKNFVGNPNW